MAESNLNFTGLYNSNIEPQDRKVDSFQQYIDNSALKANQKPNFGKIETMSFYNPLYQNQYKPRYEASWQYNNLGFDPHRDNETLYNEKMSGLDKFQRAAKQMGKVMFYSGIDQLTWGGTSLMTAEKFAEANAIGGSSEKGFYASTLNLMINAGFTLGIGAEVALENIILGGLTLGAGNLLTAAKTGKAIGTIKRGLSMAEAARKQRTVAAEIESMTKASKLSEFATKAANFMNPLENTTSFFKEMNTAERLGKGMATGEKVAKGTTALWRDVQGVRGVYTEALLEGNFAEKDMQDKWIMDYQSMYGRPPSEDEAKKFHDNAKAANFATAMINMPLIYFTNKITLAPLFRPLEKSAAGSVIGSGARRAYFDISESGLRTIKKLPEETLKRITFLAKNSPKTLAKNTLKYSGENFMEGAQEVLQEVTSGAAKEYYLDNYDGNLRGSWYDYMLSNAAAQVSKQGLETFASGMLMQAFLSPIHHVVGGVTRGATGDRTTITGRIIDKVDDFRHRDDKDYLKKKKDMRDEEEKKFNQDIDDINFFFQNAANYFNGNFEEMAKSKKFADLYKGKNYEDLTDAERAKYTDAVHQRMDEYVINAIQRGYYDSIVDQMKDMSKTLKNSREEVVGDIGEQQASILEKNVDGFIQKAQSIKDSYDKVANVFKVPFSESDMNNALRNSKNKGMTYLSMQYANEAYNKAIRDLIFAQESLKLGLSRQEKINTEAMSIFNEKSKYSKMSWDNLSVLYDLSSIQERLLNIQGMLNGTGGGEGLLSTKESERPKAMNDQIKNLELEQTALSDILKSLNALEKPDSKENKHKDIEKKLKRDVRSYIAIMDRINNPDSDTRLFATYDKLTDLIIDYNKISRTNKINNKSIEFLTDPEIWQRNIDIIAKAAESVHEQRNEEIKNSVEKIKQSQKDDDLTSELYKIGVGIDNLEQVKKEKKMPQKLIDIENKNEITYLDEKYKAAVEIVQRYIPDIEDIPIPERKELESYGVGLEDSKTIDEFRDIGIEIGKEYTAKQIIQIFLRESVLEGEKGGYKGRRMLANAFLSIPKIDGVKVKIVNNADKSVSFKSGEITLDLRYFSKNHEAYGDYSFALMKGITGALTVDALNDKESDFYKKMSALYTEAQNLFKKEKYKEEEDMPSEMIGFRSLTDFVIESLTNERFQIVISKLKLEKATNSYNRNVFSSFVNNVKQLFMNMFKMFKSNVPESVFDESLSIITDYISEGKKEVTKEIEIAEEKPLYSISKNSSGTTLVSNLTDDEKTIVTNTYLLVTDQKRNDRSDNEILTSDDFLQWFSDDDNFTTTAFINSHNKTFDIDKEQFDPFKINLKDIESTDREEKEYENTGKPTRMRLAIMAVKFMEGNDNLLFKESSEISDPELDFLTDFEKKIWKDSHLSRKTIREIRDKVVESTLKENLTKQKTNENIDKLVSLGYDREKLYKMSQTKVGPVRIANMASLGISFDDFVNFVHEEEMDIAGESHSVLIEESLKAVRDLEALDSWRSRALSTLSEIPYSSVPTKASIFEIERMYNEKRKQLEEEGEEEILVPEVDDIIGYKGQPYFVSEVDTKKKTCVIVDGNGEEFEINYIDDQEHIEDYGESAKQVWDEYYDEVHQSESQETSLSPEEQKEVADKIEKEQDTEEEIIEEELEEKPKVEKPKKKTKKEEKINNILLNLSKNIVDNFKNCK